MVQTDKKSLEYRVIKEEGPAHQKYFEVEVLVDGIVYGTGSGSSKKQAEQNAAKDAYNKSKLCKYYHIDKINVDFDGAGILATVAVQGA